MQVFYKIEEGKALVGSGELIPDSFTEYVLGQEPKELIEALENEQVEQELQAKLQEASQYLKDTDWVKMYLLEHYLGLNLLPEDSYKFEIERIRKEKIEFIRSNS